MIARPYLLWVQYRPRDIQALFNPSDFFHIVTEEGCDRQRRKAFINPESGIVIQDRILVWI